MQFYAPKIVHELRAQRNDKLGMKNGAGCRNRTERLERVVFGAGKGWLAAKMTAPQRCCKRVAATPTYNAGVLFRRHPGLRQE
jgi:hypothetical protein